MDDGQIIDKTKVTPADAQEAPAPGPKRFPVADTPLHQAFESGRYPYARLMGRASYEVEKAKLQAELLKVQIWAQETGQKFVILMEGRDAAGKGGTIKRFMEHTWKKANGFFNAILPICRRAAKWSSTTGPGTTARGSSG